MDRPLAKGSVSLRIYPHELAAAELVTEMRTQALLASQAGFDGVMTAEHHGGFNGYIPNPTQMAGFLLEAMTEGWAAACPVLLPLRHWTQVAEEFAWLAARFPGRVGAGFAAGGLDRDFEMVDLPFAENRARFKSALPRVVAALRGETEPPLADDQAIAACAEDPLPMVTAAQGPLNARRAARLGVGVIYDSLQTTVRMREVSDAYLEAGGRAARIAIRRVWIGPLPGAKARDQVDFYRSYAGQEAQAHWGSGQEQITGRDGAEVADGLLALLSEGSCDAFNLRVHVQGVGAEATREQITRLGDETLPLLREGIAKLGL